MSTQETALVGLKRELKAVRGRVRELRDENARWQAVAQTLKKIAALDEDKFMNLLRSENLFLVIK